MIPTIEDIVSGLQLGVYCAADAEKWLNEHVKLARESADRAELRDGFAAAALQGMLAYSHVNPMCGNYHENCTLDQAAESAYAYADAMLKAREKS